MDLPPPGPYTGHKLLPALARIPFVSTNRSAPGSRRPVGGWFPFRRFVAGTAAAILLGGLLSGCTDTLEMIRERYRPDSPREAYAQSLRDTGLADRTIGRRWIAVGESSLDVPVEPDLPYREVTALDPALPEAHGYRFTVTRGRRVEVQIHLDSSPGTLVFADLFESLDDRGLGLRRVASADSLMRFSYDVNRSGIYILRIQPELLAEGRYELTVRTDASIIFPVSGRSEYDIGSVFGDPRDGGRRQHHGLDIFAPRGTPVVAAVNGTVRSTRTGGLGGKTVWLRDSSNGNSLYYAHLDEQLVARGQRVEQGDTLGLVGNTGNARTTPPHLHFGIYSNGPADPYPFVRRSRRSVLEITANTDYLGSWMRVAGQSVRFATQVSGRPVQDERLPRHTSLRVVGAHRNQLRVSLPDGRTGYIEASTLEPLDQPIEQRRLELTYDLLAEPHQNSPGLGSLSPGEDIPVVGRFKNYLHVSTETGRTGWVQTL